MAKLTALALVSTLLFAPAVRAEDTKPAPGIRESIAKVRFDVPTDYRQKLPPHFKGPTSSREVSSATKATVGLVGGIGGFFAGGLIGSAIEPNCHCDDPGLRGFTIGAPIGAIAGAIGAFRLVSR